MNTAHRFVYKYGNNTITRFDIVGSFFVNLFYNELFKKSNSLKQQTLDKSATDIYKELLVAYSDFTTREEFFKQSVKGIHAYVISNTNQIDMTHKECIDFIVKEFVPDKIFISLRDVQKSKIFHDTMSSVVKKFIAKLISKYIKIIMDYRDLPSDSSFGKSSKSELDYSTILQNEFLDIICQEKDKVYSKFITTNSKDTISLELHRNKIKSIMSIMSSKNDEIENQKNIIKKTADVIKKLRSKIEEKNILVKQLENKINSLESKLKATVIKQKIKPSTIAAKSNRLLSIDTTNSLDTMSDKCESALNNVDSSSDSVNDASDNYESDSDAGSNLSMPPDKIEKKEDVTGSSLLFDESDDYY